MTVTLTSNAEHAKDCHACFSRSRPGWRFHWLWAGFGLGLNAYVFTPWVVPSDPTLGSEGPEQFRRKQKTNNAHKRRYQEKDEEIHHTAAQWQNLRSWLTGRTYSNRISKFRNGRIICKSRLRWRTSWNKGVSDPEVECDVRYIPVISHHKHQIISFFSPILDLLVCCLLNCTTKPITCWASTVSPWPIKVKDATAAGVLALLSTTVNLVYITFGICHLSSSDPVTPISTV